MEQARVWYGRAAEQGHKGATAELANIQASIEKGKQDHQALHAKKRSLEQRADLYISFFVAFFQLKQQNFACQRAKYLKCTQA